MGNYWELSDALAFRCPVEWVGLRRESASELLDSVPRETQLDNESLREIALRALVRETEGTGRSAVNAAVALLDHVSRETQRGIAERELVEYQAKAFPPAPPKLAPWERDAVTRRYQPAGRVEAPTDNAAEACLGNDAVLKQLQ